MNDFYDSLSLLSADFKVYLKLDSVRMSAGSEYVVVCHIRIECIDMSIDG